MKPSWIVGLLFVVLLCLGLGSNASASIVYSGALNGGAGYELNGPGNYNWVYLDFASMTASYSSLSHVDYSFYSPGSTPVNAVAAGSNFFDYSGFMASTKAYASGQVIPAAGADWFQGAGFLSWDWTNNVAAFVGIKMSDNKGGYDFGWIEVLYVSKSTGDAKILSFAYENSGNPIRAGDTIGAPVPIPAAILLFAPGLAGLIFIRRRLGG